jgi:formate/nitrite transporter FocA (FNT family)
MKQWWWWNQIPVTLGNLVAGALFTGIALWYTYGRKERYTTQPMENPAAEAVAGD